MRFVNRHITLAFALSGVFTLAVSARAQDVAPGANKDETKCMASMSKGLVKFAVSRVKCVAKCRVRAGKGLLPLSDCIPPYDGTTLACVSSPLPGAEAKAVAKIQKGCLADCPPCYSGADCPAEIDARVAAAAAYLDYLISFTWCDDTGSFDGLTSAEAKCEDSAGQVIGKVWAADIKCYDKCVSNMVKGVVPPGSCTPYATDAATQACLELASTKVVFKAWDLATCYDTPECFGGIYNYPGSWHELVFSGTDLPQTYCGSPSGAFLN